MAQAITASRPAQTIDDYDAIARVVQLYIDGMAKGDVVKLKEAFHADARMFGSFSGTRYDVPISELFTMAADEPADADGTYRGRLIAVEQVGDAASAVVAEDGVWGHGIAFIDYFSLARIDGTWKIVNKTFAHTGGEMPES
jgi:hypothetical protein